jgi:HEAT repeat protein
MKTFRVRFAFLIVIAIFSILYWRANRIVSYLSTSIWGSSKPADAFETSHEQPVPAKILGRSVLEKLDDAQLLELMRQRRELAKSFAQKQGDSGDNTNSLPHILELLSDSDSYTGEWYDAPWKLGALGRDALAGLPRVVELLHGTNEKTADGSARALACMSRSNPEAFQVLTNSLTDPTARVRDAATMAVSLLYNLQYKNVDTDSVLPMVLRNLRDSDLSVRLDSAQAIGQYIDLQQKQGKTAEPKMVIPVLVQNLADPNIFGRSAALAAISQYGREAEWVAPEVSKLVDDPDAQVQTAAKRALKEISQSAEATRN